MLYCVLKQAATSDSKFWSDKLLHETLYLCCVILDEEDASHKNSLFKVASGIVGSKWPPSLHIVQFCIYDRVQEFVMLLYSVQSFHNYIIHA